MKVGQETTDDTDNTDEEKASSTLLFFRTQSYPWKSLQDDLAAAETLLYDCGH